MLGNITKWINDLSSKTIMKVIAVVFVLGVIAMQLVPISLLYFGTLNNNSSLQVDASLQSINHEYEDGTQKADVKLNIKPYTPIYSDGSIYQKINNHKFIEWNYLDVSQERLYENQHILQNLPGDNISDTTELEQFKENGAVYIGQPYEADTYSAMKKVDEDKISFDIENQKLILSDVNINNPDNKATDHILLVKSEKTYDSTDLLRYFDRNFNSDVDSNSVQIIVADEDYKPL